MPFLADFVPFSKHFKVLKTFFAHFFRPKINRETNENIDLVWKELVLHVLKLFMHDVSA